MARYEHLPIYKKAMDLTIYFEKIVRNFSRYHKYTLGSELREKSREIVGLIIKANSTMERVAALLECGRGPIHGRKYEQKRFCPRDSAKSSQALKRPASENWAARKLKGLRESNIYSKRRHTMKVFSRLCGLKVAMLWGVTVAVATLLIAHPAAAQSAGGYCFAKIDGSTGAVLTSGGFCAVTGTRTSPGTYTVSFFGSFPPAITPGNVVVNTTAESAIFGVSNAVAGPVVNPGQIDVTAFTWSSPTATPVDNTFFISLFVGQ